MSPGSTGRILTDGNALPHLYQERYGHGSDYDEAEKPVKDFIKYERSEGLSVPHFEWDVKPRYTYRDGEYVTRCAPAFRQAGRAEGVQRRWDIHLDKIGTCPRPRA